MAKPYHHFSEVEEEIREATKEYPVVYKFRDWQEGYHKRIVTHREAFFAHPFTLNDPHDIRPPYNYIVDGIDWGKFRMTLFSIGRETEKNLNEAELTNEVEKRFNEAKNDPIGYMQRNRSKLIQDEKFFDPIGVFSCCLSSSNEAMWAHYGKNHSGFALGFDTVEVCNAMNCGFGFVDYSDAPIDHYVLGDNSMNHDKEIFQKSTSWSLEEEFRFITHGIGRIRERAFIYPPEIVKEIVFGIKTLDKTISEVMDEANKTFKNVQFYRVAIKSDSYGFDKIQI